MNTIGLMAAVPAELEHLGRHFVETARRDIAGLAFRSGTLDGRPVVAVEAGVGKVNAALVATLLLQEFGCGALLFTGVAGGLDPALGVGDVVIGRRLIAHDYGAIVGQRIVVYQPGALPLPGQPQEHGYTMPEPLARKVDAALEGLVLPELSAAAAGGAPRRPRLVSGTILTGDTFLNCAVTRDRLFAQFHAQAIEMEGAALAQVAERFGAPWVVIRALSDRAGEDSHISFTAFVTETATVAALLARRIVPVLAG